MPPRKSLLSSTPTPSRSSRHSIAGSNAGQVPTSTLKRSRSKRHIESSPDPLAIIPTPRNQSRDRDGQAGQEIAKTEVGVNGPEEEDKNDVDNAEMELEAWQDFAADHYEMVEQLPLELHRNFRLLRELDDGCLAQIERLHHLTRHYVNERLELEKKLQKKRSPAAEIAEKENNEAAKEGETKEEEMVETQNGKKEEEVNEALPINGNEDIQMNEPLLAQSEDIADGGGGGGGDGQHAKEAAIEKQENQELLENTQIIESVLIPDGQGGLVLPAHVKHTQSNEGDIEIPPRLHFPPRDEDDEIDPKLRSEGSLGNVENGEKSEEVVNVPVKSSSEIPLQAHAQTDDHSQIQPQTQPQPQTQANTETQNQITSSSSTLNPSADPPETNGKKRKRPDGPHAHLSEISRLSKEIVRTAEEKVAVAVGAYNAIDRHIRALDSALTAQEASILLGLRPSTLPSTNVDDALNLPGDLSTLQNVQQGDGIEGDGEDEEAEEGGMVIGTGGGLGNGTNRKRRGKNRRGKKGNRATENQKEGQGGMIGVNGDNQGEGEGGDLVENWNIPADPNEPRYCYCHQVSYGAMVGCENEDCPLEWFHLACVGLTTPPIGQWYCNICKPKIGLGKGGAGKIGNKNITGVSGGSSRKKR